VRRRATTEIWENNMRKILVTGAAALFATLAIAAMPATASAGGVSFGVGYGWGGGYYGGWHPYHNHVYVQVPVVVDDYNDDESDWDMHVEWCEDHYQTYDEDTNLYFYKPGKQKACVSPYS
jgi:hypothetical protein